MTKRILTIFCIAFCILYSNAKNLDPAGVSNLYRNAKLSKSVKIKTGDLTNQAVLALWDGRHNEVLEILGKITRLRLEAIWIDDAPEVYRLFEKGKVSPNYDGFLTLIEGWAYLGLSQYEDALQTFEKVSYLTINPSFKTDAIIGKSLSLMCLKKFEEAFSAIKVVYVENAFATSLGAHIMGKCYFYMNKPDEAMSYFQQALAHDPQNYGAHLDAAKIFEFWQKPLAAWQSYAALAMVDTDDIFLQNKLIQFSDAVKGDPINYVFYARLRHPLQKEKRHSPSQKVRVGLYSGKKGLPANLKKISFVTSGSFKIISDDGRILLKDSAGKKYSVQYNSNMSAVEIKDKWNRAVHTSGNFSIETEKGTSILIKDAKSVSIFDRDYSDKELRGLVKVYLSEGGLNLVNEVFMEDYLPGALGVIKAGSQNIEALKALAIVLRTKVLQALQNPVNKDRHFDICDSDACITYKGLNMESRPVVQAVDETQGEFLSLDIGDIKADVDYFTACGGYTLQGIADTAEKRQWFVTPSKMYERIIAYPSGDLACMPEEVKKLSDVKWSILIPAEDVYRRAKRVLGIDELISFTPLKRTIYGHILSAKFTGVGKSVTVTDFDKINLVLAGGALRSNIFYVIPLDNSSKLQAFLIRGMSTGSGSGFCIRGAEGLANKGKTYGEILKHYFPAATLKKPM